MMAMLLAGLGQRMTTFPRCAQRVTMSHHESSPAAMLLTINVSAGTAPLTTQVFD